MTLHLDSGGAPMHRPDIDAFIARLVSRRDEAEYLADRLIEALDDADGDADLEDGDADIGIDDLPHDEHDQGDDEHPLGWNAMHSQIGLGSGAEDGDNTAPERRGEGFVRCAPDDHEDDGGAEGSLGAPEVEFTVRGLPERRGHVDQRRWWDGGAANDDGEPTLAQPEIGARSYVGRDAWFAGYQRNLEHEDCEGGADDDKGIDDDPHDGEDVADAGSDDLGGEPTLGAPENPQDQRRWAQGKPGCQEGDHNSERNPSRYSVERYASRDAARRQAREMIEGHRRSHRRHAPDTITFYAKPMMIGGVLVVGEIHG